MHVIFTETKYTYNQKYSTHTQANLNQTKYIAYRCKACTKYIPIKSTNIAKSTQIEKTRVT